MEQVRTIHYGRISLLFVAISLVIFWGFYRTYFVHFPAFKDFQFEQHFHGVLSMTWLAFLIVQPLLIRSEKYQLHRFIGKLSYMVAPLLVFSIYLVARTAYLRNIQTMPATESISRLALNFPSLLAFAAMYALAILNKPNTYKHMRYMIGTGLLMIGPGLGRALIIYFDMPFGQAVDITHYISLSIAVLFLVSDISGKKDFLPNTLVAAVLLMVALFFEGRYTSTWQAVGQAIVETLF